MKDRDSETAACDPAGVSNPPFRFRLGDLMAWVGLLAFCFALARAAAPLGMVAACVLTPAQLLAQRRASLLRTGGVTFGFRRTLLESARSIGDVVLAEAWTMMTGFVAAFASVVLYSLLVMAVSILLVAGGIPLEPVESFYPGVLGVVVGISAGVIALVREFRRIWRHDVAPTEPLTRDPPG